jgi:hypothetical protein
MGSVSIRARGRWCTLALCAALALSACGGDEEEVAATDPPPAPSPPPAPPPPGGGTNRAPTISGTPLAATLYGRVYSFTPTASDADGNALTFSVSGRPAWASFNSSTGRLQGMPAQADVGTNANVTISVSDGTATTNLPAFNIQVVATATGSAMLSWNPPSQNSDGSPLTNLASYRVHFGTASGSYLNSMTVNNPGIATFVVDQLTPATWHFVVTAVNADGVESAFSNAATKTVL